MRDHLTFIPGWKQLLAVTLPLLLGAGAVAGAYAYTSGTAKPSQAVQDTAAAPADANVPAPAGLLVHVIGAVEHPGLYRMRRGDRVYDAIASAGGLSVDAGIPPPPTPPGR